MIKIVKPYTKTIKRFGSFTRGKKRKLLWKDRTHSYIDQIWNTREYCTRNEMYSHLESHLGSCPHVSMMSIGKMKSTILWAIEILNAGRELDKKYNKYEWELLTVPTF